MADVTGNTGINPVMPKAWVRDSDRSLVRVGQVSDGSYSARLWRLPTQFLMDNPPDWLPGVWPWLVWGALAALVVRLFRR